MTPLTWVGGAHASTARDAMHHRLASATALVTVAASIGASPAPAQPAPPISCTAPTGTPPPVIDVHMHAVAAQANGPASGDVAHADDAVIDAIRAELDRHNVVRVVVSSLTLSRTAQWAARDPRFVPSLAFRDTSMPIETVRDLLQRGVVQALGELGFQYAGLRPDDPTLDAYFGLAEERDVPVAIHMAGGGLPDVPGFRVRLGDPLLLEEVLIRHPKLRVNVMHAGLPFLDGMLAIMRRYPQVYADLSKISDARAYPREQFHDYLHSLMRAGLGERLMFGSDAAGAGAVGPSIDGIMTAPFLSSDQTRAILCENAVRFFRLPTRPTP